MAMSPRQTIYLGHLLRAAKATGRLGIETLKMTPHMFRSARRASKSRLGAAGVGFAVGNYTGYRIARKAQEKARRYVFGDSRR